MLGVAVGCSGGARSRPQAQPNGTEAQVEPNEAARGGGGAAAAGGLHGTAGDRARGAAESPVAESASGRRESSGSGGRDRSADSAPRGGGPRLWSQDYLTWIWAQPKVKGRFLGTMRVGQSVALRSLEKVEGQGCSKGFFQIEPRGYVCHDRTVTRSAATPFLRAVAYSLPRAGPFPYDYALSNGAPMYTRVPTPLEQKRTEWQYGPAGEFKPLGMFQRGHEHLAVTDPIRPTDRLPAFLADGGSARGRVKQLLRRSIPHGSMLAYTRAFEVDGRTFLLSADLTVVPANRVRPFRRSAFHGVKLGEDVRLPVGWFREKPRPRYRRSAAGGMAAAGSMWPVRSWVHVQGDAIEVDGKPYLPVRAPRQAVREAVRAQARSGRGRPREAEHYAAQADVTVVRPVRELPFGVAADDKWILVSITAGTLVAYEGLRPVFTTLVSPGQGGVPIKGRDHVKYSTTPLGAYRITFKDRASTMSPEMGEDRSFWIADVPFTQYFNPPFALHGAYWHEKFGEFMSGGCINASPIDAQYLFDWTEPKVPDGWQGATGAGAKENGKATWIVVRR